MDREINRQMDGQLDTTKCIIALLCNASIWSIKSIKCSYLKKTFLVVVKQMVDHLYNSFVRKKLKLVQTTFWFERKPNNDE